MPKQVELARGISAVIGAAILLAVMMLFAAFYIVALDKLATASQEALKRVSEAGASTATLSSVKAVWSYDGSNVVIHMENQATKTVLVVAIAIVYADGSYTVASRANGSIQAFVVIDGTATNKLQLPLGVPPAKSLTITMDAEGKRPISASIAIEASPVVAVVAAEKRGQVPVPTARAVGIELVAPGATTWLGKAAIPTTKSGTTNKSYPQHLESIPIDYTIARTGRGAVTYTDFEVYPVPGWTARGGVWSSASGYKGGALRGADNNGGLGGASQYYYNTDLSQQYSSLWVSAKTRLVSGVGFHGIALLNGGRNRLYAIVVATGGRVEVWSYNVEARNGWQRLAQATIPGYSSANWYTIVTRYAVAQNAVNFYVYVYDTSGNQVASLTTSSTHRRRFTPAYVGVIVDGVTALFEDFIISAADPRYVTVSGLGGGYVVVIDNLGDTVGSAANGASVSVSVVSDIVVGTGVDGKIRVYDSNGDLVAEYVASDCILGGDSYALYPRLYSASFSDVASLSNVVQLFSANVSLSLTTNTSTTLDLYVNGTLVVSRDVSGGFSDSIPIPSNLLQGAQVFNVTLVLKALSPFQVVVSVLQVSGFGYFEDHVIDAHLLGSGTEIRFYNATELISASSLEPLYNVSTYVQFNGSVAIAYNSTNYVLYMVNGSGVYAWNPLGWSLETDGCRAVGPGARVEVVESFIAVLPGEPSSYVCVYDASRDVAYNISLATYRFYRYTASAVNGTSIVFTALDSRGGVVLASLDLLTNETRQLAVVPLSCAAGLAVDGSRVYIVSCGLWRGITGVDRSGIGVWIYSARAGVSNLVIIANTSAVRLLECCDRVEVYRNTLITVDAQNILVIDRASDLEEEKSVAIYAT
uniref:DUF2341 domain-containing protein n=1 Tax=Ignisphaera aggregans TaxID=334771 RepID=A0A7C4FHQ1_9CREN